MLDQLRPDLVTMDISMPAMNGIDSIKKILGKFPDAKIVVISTSDEKIKVLEAIRCGAKHYVLKPFAPEKIVEVINEVLGKENKVEPTKG